MFGALYLRISRDKGENEDTLQNHREIMNDFCSKNGITFESYEEIVSGGTHEIDKRPQLEKLISNIEKYECILSISLDRLSRNGLVSQTIKQMCIDYNIKIVTPSQSFDLANKQDDRVLFDVSSMFATMEYEMIAKRNKVNKLQRAKRGEWIAGASPFGYTRDDETKKLIIDENEARVIRYIFELHSQGLGSRRIVDKLNEEGYKPARNDVWNLPSVKRIIRNPAYKGTVVYTDRKKVKKGNKYTYQTVESIVTDNAHPPIIDPIQWEQANKEREERAEKTQYLREKPARETTLLKDVLFCGTCGKKLSIRKEPNGVYTIKPCEYLLPNSPDKCSNSGMKVEFLEQEVIDRLKQYKTELESELEQLKGNDLSNVENDLRERLERLEGQIQTVKQKQRNLLELALEGVFSHEELKDKKQELIEQGQRLELSREQLLKQLEQLEVEPATTKIENILELLENFETLPVDAQNNVIKQVIKKVHFKREIPEEIKKLSTRNPARRNFPFTYEIEYF